PEPRRDVDRGSRRDARVICSRERSGSRCAISPCSTARDIAGCWDPKTESGTAASMSGGCRLILRAGSSALTAGITIWAGTATAWSAESASTEEGGLLRQSPIVSAGGRLPTATEVLLSRRRAAVRAPDAQLHV